MMIRKRSLLILVMTLFHTFLDALGNNSINNNLKFKRKPLDILAVQDEDIMFSCKITGQPIPVVTWSKREGVIPDRADVSDSSLRINNVVEADQGEYVCHGTNLFGTVEASARLIVQTAPIFTREPANQTAVQGENITMTCSVSGLPVPTMFWAKEGSQDLLFPGHASFNSDIKVDHNGDLKIYNVKKSDEGFYLCSGLNSAGSSKSQAYLTIIDKDILLRDGNSSNLASLNSTFAALVTVLYLVAIQLFQTF